MPTVLIATHPFGAEPLQKLKTAGFHIIGNPHNRRLTAADLLVLLPPCEAVIAGTEPYNHEVLSATPQLRLIARVGTGIDNIDLAQAKHQGIHITTTQAAATSVAEFTVGLMLALLSGMVPSHQALKQGQWQRTWGDELQNQPLGLIGCGQVGQRVAKLAQAFGMRVQGYDPYLPEHTWSRVGIQSQSLETVLQTSLVVSLHIPLTPETTGLINATTLELMRPGAYLINTARGGVVDEHALYHALVSGQLAGAALDVFQQEPYLGALTELNNVILTPHMAGNTRQARWRMEQDAVKAVWDFFAL